MKAYKKWWENKTFERKFDKKAPPHDYFDHMAPYNVGEHIWRAALKEVLKVIIEESNGPSNPKDLMAWLHEELEEE